MKSPLQWLVVASLSMVSGISFSQTRYVSNTGTDVSNDCSTPGNPCGTISHAYAEAAAADTIKIAPGNYSLTSTLSLLQPVVITALDPSDRPVITSTASDVISVGVSDVTISHLKLNMGLTASTGLRGIVANNNFDKLDIHHCDFVSTKAVSTGMVFGAYAVALEAPVGQIYEVTITDNVVTTAGPSGYDFFGRGFGLGNSVSDGISGTVSNNEVMAYYTMQVVRASGTMLITNNELTGIAMINYPINNAVIQLNFNTISGGSQLLADNLYALIDIRAIENGTVAVNANTIENYTNIGLLSMASKNVFLNGNTFTPLAAATDFISLMANTKLMTNGVQGNTFSDEISIKSNTFNAGVAGQGKAIVFADHYGVNVPAFAAIAVGGPTASEKNTFDTDLGSFIALDELSGPSTAFPLWAVYSATTMAPFVQDINAYAIYNDYGLTTLAAIEARNHDKLDNSTLGKIHLTVNGTNRYVATTGSDALNECTLPGSPCLTIERALAVAIDADSVIVAPGNYALTSVLNITQEGLVMTAADATDKPVITTNQANIIDVNAENVTVNGFEFTMGLTNATGIKGIVSTASNFNQLQVTNNDFVSTAALDTEGMVWSAFAVQLTSAAGETDTVSITGNTVATSATNLNVFGRGFYLGSGSANGPGGVIANNDIKAYYAIQTANITTDLTVESNDINGITMLNAPLNNANFDVNNNTFSGADMNANMTSDSLYAVVDIRGIASGSVDFYENTLEEFTTIGLLSMASKEVFVVTNEFTPKTASASFTSIMANTKLMTNGVQGNTYGDEITIIGNTFNAGEANEGTAIIFADHYGVNTPAFADVTIGGPTVDEKNTFDPDLGNYIVLDEQTGASTAFPLWAPYPATTMKAFTQNIEALYIHNEYMLPNVATVELKNIDSVDNNALGKIILATTFVGLDELSATVATLYPNPAISSVTIELTDANATAELSLVDLLGNVVYTSAINGSATVDVSNFTSGVYIVRLNNNGQVSSTRFVKN